MPLTNFPYGLTSFGVPLIGSTPLIPPTTGKYFWVNSATGQNSNGKGTAPDTPFKTLAYAITKCVASRGDVIVLAPGHAEDIIAAGTITLNIEGVSIIGLTQGSLRPLFTFKTAVGATFLISAGNCLVQNVVFNYTGIDAITTGLTITGNNNTIRGCRFSMGNVTNQCTNCITVGVGAATGDGTLIEYCDFMSPNAGPATGITGVVGTDNLKVRDCRFVGNFSTAAIYNVTVAWTNVDLVRNRMYVASATGIGISIVATATGVISDNYTYVTANIAAGGSIAAAAAALFNNQGMELAHAGASAQLDPTAGGFA